jgi:hypothetical protein
MLFTKYFGYFFTNGLLDLQADFGVYRMKDIDVLPSHFARRVYEPVSTVSSGEHGYRSHPEFAVEHKRNKPKQAVLGFDRVELYFANCGWC